MSGREGDDKKKTYVSAGMRLRKPKNGAAEESNHIGLVGDGGCASPLLVRHSNFRLVRVDVLFSTWVVYD